MRAERDGPPDDLGVSATRWWYLSFADPARPKGEQFLGAAIVDGEDLASAITSAWRRGCNPGGEVMGIEITSISDRVVESYRFRLLTRDEAEQAVEP